MRLVFADSCYWIALLHPQDNLHGKVQSLIPDLTGSLIVTSDAILTEVLDHFSGKGGHFRKIAGEYVQQVSSNLRVKIVKHEPDKFRDAVAFYIQHGDKEWSMVDCLSMLLMREEGINDVLTSDHHFTQAGFSILIK